LATEPRPTLKLSACVKAALTSSKVTPSSNVIRAALSI
jgi:hypothetical protein